jgi:hypothetical protein
MKNSLIFGPGRYINAPHDTEMKPRIPGPRIMSLLYRILQRNSSQHTAAYFEKFFRFYDFEFMLKFSSGTVATYFLVNFDSDLNSILTLKNPLLNI